MRIMGIDYGSKRIGIAMSDELFLTAQGFDTILNRTSAESIEAIKRLVMENAVKEVVVGLPISMNGTHSQKTKEVAEFTEELSRALSVPVRNIDERLTTVQAERALLDGDMSRGKRRQLRDKIAAQLILQSYLDSQRKG
jgi:putative Holliday junction resolvase